MCVSYLSCARYFLLGIFIRGAGGSDLLDPGIRTLARSQRRDLILVHFLVLR